MPTTEQILEAAKDLGKLVSSHDAAQRYEQVVKQLRESTDAQRLLTDYNRHVSAVAEKEAAGKPIEVEEKHKLQSLQEKMIQDPVLRELQVVQMDYLDLMRSVNDAIEGRSESASPATSPMVNPEV